MTEPQVLLALAERLRVSAAEDRIQEMRMVMNRIAYTLQAIATGAAITVVDQQVARE